MSALFRLFRIFHTAGRYRLDILFANAKVSKKLSFITCLFIIYPSPKENRGKRLRHALESLGPIFVKFGQLLSTRPDLIPADIILELNNLQDNVAPFDDNVFKDIVEKALGNSVDEIFAHFETRPLASASIAQVHAATLKSGEEVIVKAVRPGIEKTIEQDIALLKIIAKLVESMSADGQRLKPVEIVDDYRNTIFDELNLALEAANASQLRRNFENSDTLYIPEIYWEYSKSNVMVMERIYGIPITDLDKLRAQNTNMKLLAERGVEIFFTQVFEHNFFHADMHPGNVFVSFENPARPSYIAVDMAIVGSLTREDQYYLARNLLAMFRRDYRQVAELHVLSGWVPAGTSVSGFESAIRAVCEPVFEKPLREISFGEALITIFKTAQRYNMPVQPQLVLLQKTLLNIEGLGRQLYPDLNLWETAHPFLERWIKQRFHPNTLWKEFRYNAPELMEKLPALPHMLLGSLQNIQKIADTAPRIAEASEALEKGKKSKKRLKKIVLLGCLGLIAAQEFYAWESNTAILIAVAALIVVLL